MKWIFQTWSFKLRRNLITSHIEHRIKISSGMSYQERQALFLGTYNVDMEH